MEKILNDAGLDLLFRQAHTNNAWLVRPVSDVLLEALWDLTRWPPTSANCSPLRVVFCSFYALADHCGGCGARSLDRWSAAPQPTLRPRAPHNIYPRSSTDKTHSQNTAPSDDDRQRVPLSMRVCIHATRRVTERKSAPRARGPLRCCVAVLRQCEKRGDNFCGEAGARAREQRQLCVWYNFCSGRHRCDSMQ